MIDDSPPFDPLRCSIRDVQRALLSKRLTCVGLVTQMLARIDAHDQAGVQINAMLHRNDAVFGQAQALDDRLQSGELLPLHGIPVLIKDNIDTYDMPTTGGSLCLKDRRPTEDATVVRRLRAAGALVIGKSNLHELTIGGETVSSLGGQTKNPYSLDRTPGGSSGGSAAGVAAGFAVAALGTDTVQSVRSPASATNLVGVRPTHGLVSRTGVMPVSPTLDEVGPLARTVEDAARILEVIAGGDPCDSSTVRGRDTSKQVARGPAESLCGVVLGSVEQLVGTGPEHREVSREYVGFTEILQELGAEIVSVHLEGLEEVREIIEPLIIFEWKAALDAYLSADPPGSARSMREIIAHETYTASVSEFLHEAQSIANHQQIVEYQSALNARAQLRRLLFESFSRHGIDALIYPHQKRLVARIGERQLERNGFLASMSGFPAIVVPGPARCSSHLSTIDEYRSGIPMGMEFLGRPYSENHLFGIAASYEMAVPLRVPSIFEDS